MMPDLKRPTNQAINGVTRKEAGILTRFVWRKYAPRAVWTLENGMVIVENANPSYPVGMIAGAVESTAAALSRHGVETLISIIDSSAIETLASGERVFRPSVELGKLVPGQRRISIEGYVELELDHTGRWRLGSSGHGHPLHKMATDDWAVLSDVLKTILQNSEKPG